MEIWIARAVALVFAAISAFGFLNACCLRHHGPGIDLGIVAGVLAIAACVVARYLRRHP